MMVVFQNKIIYMPGIPLGAKRERVEDYVPLCRGVQWREVKIPTEDGVVLSGVVGGVTVNKNGRNYKSSPTLQPKRVLILYLQGFVVPLPLAIVNLCSDCL